MLTFELVDWTGEIEMNTNVKITSSTGVDLVEIKRLCIPWDIDINSSDIHGFYSECVNQLVEGDTLNKVEVSVVKVPTSDTDLLLLSNHHYVIAAWVKNIKWVKCVYRDIDIVENLNDNWMKSYRKIEWFK